VNGVWASHAEEHVSHNDCVIVVLLPGADGTAELFKRFIKELPTNVEVTLDYEQLAELAFELPQEKPYIIIAESYSGPVATTLATRSAGDLRAIVLVASFVARPLGLLAILGSASTDDSSSHPPTALDSSVAFNGVCYAA
jgi:hypothetical protein